jgi:hypothetical protein
MRAECALAVVIGCKKAQQLTLWHPAQHVICKGGVQLCSSTTQQQNNEQIRASQQPSKPPISTQYNEGDSQQDYLQTVHARL